MRSLLQQKKATSAMIIVISGIILSLLSILVYYAYFRGSMSLSTDPNIASCQQSAAAAGAIRTPVADTQIFTYNCPISSTEIKFSELSQKATASKLKEVGYEESQLAKYNLERAMWEETTACLQKVNFGVLPLFNRELLGSGETYCVVCSIVSFDQKIKTEMANQQYDSKSFVIKANVPGYGEPISTILYERKNMDKILSGVRTNFNVQKTQAVVYYFTPISSIGKVFPGWLASNMQIADSEMSWIKYVPGSTAAVWIGNKVTNTDTSAFESSDSDGILIIDYENPGSLDHDCTYFGNEKYKESQV